jgi:hypothetical protein
MTCRGFGVNQAEQRSPHPPNDGNQQQQDKRDDRLFLHHYSQYGTVSLGY